MYKQKLKTNGAATHHFYPYPEISSSGYTENWNERLIMAIFQLYQERSTKRQAEETVPYTETFEFEEGIQEKKRDSFFSSLLTRFFFFILLIADLLWGVYALALLVFSLIGGIVTCFQAALFKSLFAKAFLMVRRCLICGLSLFVGFFSPAFGIMVACTYFLMYDKSGIEEVIPSSLQDQFKDIFKPNS